MSFNFCMRKKTKKHKSSSSSSSSDHYTSKKFKKNKQQKKKKNSQAIVEEEKEMCHDIIQSYIKPKLKQLVTLMINSSIQHQDSAHCNVTLKSGKEIIVEKTYANQMLNLNICSEINPNSSHSLNQNDSKTFADDLIGSLEHDLIVNCSKKVHRWEKLLSFFSFSQYLKSHLPAPSHHLTEEEPKEKTPESINKEADQQLIAEVGEAEVEEVELKQKEIISAPVPDYQVHPGPQFTKAKIEQPDFHEVHQPPPENKVRRISLIGEFPKMHHDTGFMKRIQTFKRRSLSRKRNENGKKNNSHSSKRHSDPSPKSPLRQLDKVWSDYDNVHIPERDKNIEPNV